MFLAAWVFLVPECQLVTHISTDERSSSAAGTGPQGIELSKVIVSNVPSPK